jgi:hypothetical protein
MATIDELTSEQLTHSETLEKIRTMVHGFVIYEEMSNAWGWARKLENRNRELLDSSPEIYKQYEKLTAQLKFIALPFLTDEQIFDLIEKHSLKVIQAEIDIKRKISAYLTSRSVFVRDQIKRNILASLKKNQEKLENKTLGEWLLAYDKFAGARRNTSIERTKFLTQDPEAKNLSEESKQHLSKILEFYDNLKITIPIPIIEVSEITLKEYFAELNVPLPTMAPLPIKPIIPIKPIKAEESKPKQPEIKPTPPPKKPSILSSLVRPISMPSAKPPKTEEIPTFSKEAEKSGKKFEEEKKETTKTEKVEPKPIVPPSQYRIRTMKQDIEMVKKQPIPQKPEPKIKDNIVDLSGK